MNSKGFKGVKILTMLFSEKKKQKKKFLKNHFHLELFYICWIDIPLSKTTQYQKNKEIKHVYFNLSSLVEEGRYKVQK